LRNTTVVSLAGLAAAELFPGRGAVVRGVDLGGGTADPSGFLLPEEMEMLETMTSLKRRRQWLGGRLAAKKAAAAHLGCDPAGIVITVREDGSPELRRRGRREKACVSISHSHNLAVAVAAATPCGIDVERTGPRPARLAQRFSLPQEASLLKAAGKEDGYTMLWCAKEVLRKALRPMPGFLNLELRRMTPQKYGYVMEVSGPDGECRCFATANGGYALALFVE